MATTVRTKPDKKQPPIPTMYDVADTRRLEQAVLDLEDAVLDVLEHDRGNQFHDVDYLFWSRKLKSIATQISMALSEMRGPRHFHHHYKHDPENYEQLVPVAGPAPVDTLARVCREALAQCVDIVGTQNKDILLQRQRLEVAIRGFLGTA